MTYNNDKAKEQIKNHVVSTYDKIEVEPGKCRYNFRCQYNAVHEAKKHKQDKIAMCIYLDGKYPIIHFVNYSDGKFTDNTLGMWTTTLDHYFVKWVDDSEMWNINNIFTALRNSLKKQLSWWVRLTSDYRG